MPTLMFGRRSCRSRSLSRVLSDVGGLPLIVVLCCGASAHAGASFMGAQITGSTFGEGVIASTGAFLENYVVTIPGSTAFMGGGGRGGTGGGIGPSPANLVATASTVWDASITSAVSGTGDFGDRGPGTTIITVNAAARADFFDPTNYQGFLSTAATIDFLIVDITGTGPMEFITRRTGDTTNIGFGFEAIDNGASINGNMLTPGTYRISSFAGARVDTQTGVLSVSRAGSFQIIIPGPSAAWVGVLAGVALGVRRRR